MSKKRSTMGNDVHSAMLSSDVMAFLGAAVFGNGANASGTLKKGEAAYGGLKNNTITIIDPYNPSHYVVCKNILTYSAVKDNSNVIFMNTIDYSYFINLGFEAGDEVFVVEGDLSSKIKMASPLIRELYK